MRVWLSVFFCFALALPARAGPWPREDGRWFVSLSHSTRADPRTVSTTDFALDDYTSLYVEYGLRPRLTLGFDAGLSDTGEVTAFGFVRRPIGPEDRQVKLSWHAGAGVTGPSASSEPMIVVGASVGKGVTTRWGDGWMTLDTALHLRTSSSEVVAKADATFGLKPRPGQMLILQIQTGAYSGSDPYLRLAPSYVREIAPGRHIEIGADIGFVGDDKVGLKAGIWFEF